MVHMYQLLALESRVNFIW